MFKKLIGLFTNKKPRIEPDPEPSTKASPFAPYYGKSLDQIEDNITLLKIQMEEGFHMYSIGRVVMLNCHLIIELQDQINELKKQIDDNKK